jgi:acetate kinase
MATEGYVTLNAGSSSLKFAIYVCEEDQLLATYRGEIEDIGSTPAFSATDGQGVRVAEQHWSRTNTYEELLGRLIAWIEQHLGSAQLRAVGHRVVHGGSFYETPVMATPEVLARLASLTPLAPLHQPHNLLPIEALIKLHPGLPQIACFDTSFHLSNARITRLYALPRRWSDEGIMRYGFHGLSYEFIAQELPRYERRAMGRVIVAHLGNGASMCALVGGKSVASTMGFSALDGLPMGTRSGAIDPGILLYLLQEKRMDVRSMEKMLYQESGLIGISGISSDMRILLQSDDAHAQEAVDLFVYRIARELGSLAAAAGGIDSVVFTAGIGEHAPDIRARVCAQASWLGIHLDPAANLAGGPRISTADSPVSVWVLPTNEEFIIAMHTRDIAKRLSNI